VRGWWSESGGGGHAAKSEEGEFARTSTGGQASHSAVGGALADSGQGARLVGWRCAGGHARELEGAKVWSSTPARLRSSRRQPAGTCPGDRRARARLRRQNQPPWSLAAAALKRKTPGESSSLALAGIEARSGFLSPSPHASFPTAAGGSLYQDVLCPWSFVASTGCLRCASNTKARRVEPALLSHAQGRALPGRRVVERAVNEVLRAQVEPEGAAFTGALALVGSPHSSLPALTALEGRGCRAKARCGPVESLMRAPGAGHQRSRPTCSLNWPAARAANGSLRRASSRSSSRPFGEEHRFAANAGVLGADDRDRRAVMIRAANAEEYVT